MNRNVKISSNKKMNSSAKMKGLFLSLLMSSIAGGAYADECSFTIAATDAMQFDAKTIEVAASCKEFTVNLVHSGKLPKNVMGHNWVLTSEANQRAVAADGIAAGLANNYLKVGDERVIAATAIIGGGEKTSVTFPISALNSGESYAFFCSFPGHSAIMKGSLALK